jgi:hypothetical protein
MNETLKWRWVFIVTPWPFCPREGTPVPIMQGAGWAPGRVWTVVQKKKSLASLGLELRTLQLVASRFTLWAVPTRARYAGDEIILIYGHIFECHIPELKWESENCNENAIKRGKPHLAPLPPQTTVYLGKLTVSQLVEGSLPAPQ